MATSRYSNTATYGGLTYIGTSSKIVNIRNAVKNGLLQVQEEYVRGNQRLEHISYQYYNDPSYWWVIAAASGIGWSLQLQPDTKILIPTNLQQALSL